MASNIRATWKSGGDFLAENETGGKADLGPGNIRPMEMVLASLASCAGVDVVNILEKKRVNFSDFQIKVKGTRADTHPKVYTEINITYLIWGEGIKEKDVEQAIELSENKYCSVSAMLKSTAEIHSDYQILASKKAQTNFGEEK